MANNLIAVLMAVLFVGVPSGKAQTSHANLKITITVKFDYDFRITPPCSAKVTQSCVQQFNLYEISLGVPHRAKLLTIPVPPGASGFVKGITATTEPLLFDTGRHRIAVSAQMPNGKESDLTICTTIITVP